MDTSGHFMDLQQELFSQVIVNTGGLFGSVRLCEYDYFCIQLLSKEKVFLKLIIEYIFRYTKESGIFI